MARFPRECPAGSWAKPLLALGSIGIVLILMGFCLQGCRDNKDSKRSEDYVQFKGTVRSYAERRLDDDFPQKNARVKTVSLYSDSGDTLKFLCELVDEADKQIGTMQVIYMVSDRSTGVGTVWVMSPDFRSID